jgi:hypothetical protein
MTGAGARWRASLIAAGGLAGVAGIVAWGPGVAEMVLGVPGPGISAMPAVADLVFVLVIFGAMLALAVAGGAASGVRALAAGGAPGRAIVSGGALGLGGIAASAFLAGLAGAVTPGQADAASALLIGGVAAIGVQVLAEEAVFRGWLQPLLARAWGGSVAVMVVAAAFAGLHALGGASGAMALLNLFGGGLLFGLLALRGGGIAGAVAAHFAWNAGEQFALGLDPNPGTGGFGALVDLDLVGASLWGGSAQGLNASLAMTVALAAILAWLLLDRRVGPARA